MSESALVNYKNLTKNCSRRVEPISKITIHHAAGVHKTCKTLVDSFLPSSRLASANYCIGNDGSIGQSVSESMRAWTSGSNWNDQRAITIEVSNSDNKEPWPISSDAYAALIGLCVDICQRNGIKSVNYDGTRDAVLTEHRMFKATACPGTTIHEMLTSGMLAKAVNRRLDVTPDLPKETAFKWQGVDFSPVFDPKYYAEKYADLGKAGLTSDMQLFQHFIMFGMKEARQASAGFSPSRYRQSYSDLFDAFDEDWEAYYRHYLFCGKQEIEDGLRAPYM